MNLGLLRRLKGFFKVLWQMGQDEDEEVILQQIDDVEKPALLNAVAFVFQSMLANEDPEMRSMQIQQFVHAILFCPTGQKTGIDTVIVSMLTGGLSNMEEFEPKFRQFIALLKEDLFVKAIVPGNYEQNVHVLSYYHDWLKFYLGLKSLAANNYKDNFANLGLGQFKGCAGNAFLAFFQKFTPNYLIKKFLNSVETDEMKNIHLIIAKNQSACLSEEELKKFTASKIEHPFRLNDVISYLVENEYIELNNDGVELHNWEHYFSMDPLQNYLEANLTEEGAKRILIHLGLLSNQIEEINIEEDPVMQEYPMHLGLDHENRSSAIFRELLYFYAIIMGVYIFS